MALKCEQIQAVISGRVQGVGFRYATIHKASSLGLTGWVRNTTDGTVELCAEGDPDTMEKFIQWCGTGPALAQVIEVKIIERIPIEKKTFHHFDIR